MENKYLRDKYSQILYYSGLLLLLAGFSFILPVFSLFFRPQEYPYIIYFLPSFVLSVGTGFILMLFFKPEKKIDIKTAEGGIVVVFSWATIIAFSTLPFISGLNLTPTEAFFESVSGWTTTGLSVVDVTETPAIFLLWRSIMQLLGGAGIAVIALSAILPIHDLSLYQAEARSDKLLPHVKKSTRLILKLYTSFIAVGIISYIISGMDTFGAINHAMAALSTGGFSTLPQSIGDYDSFAIEFITIILMIAGTINFATHFALFKGKVRTFFKNAEIKMLIILVAGFLFVFQLTVSPVYPEESILNQIRDFSFQIISALSTTGFSTIDIAELPALGVFFMILMMLIGGGTGSTAGGIKQYRVYLAFKSIYWTVRNELLPRRAVSSDAAWRGEAKIYIDSEQLKKVFTYIFLYLVSFVIGTAFFVQAGFPLQESMFEFASTQGTVGLSVGLTGPEIPSHLLWVQILGMFLGRLEFLIIIFSLSHLIKDIRLRLSILSRT